MRKPWLFLVAISILSCACTRHPKAEIQEIFQSDTPGWAHDIALEGNNVYVSDRQGGFLIFDQSRKWKDPRIMTPVHDVISLAPHSGEPLLASRFEGLVLVSSSGQVVDRYSNGDIANAVEIRNDLFFAAYGLHGLAIGQLRPQHIQIIAMLPTKGWSHDVKLSREQALLADWNYGLRIVDIRNPEKPAEIAAFPTPATSISIAVKEAGGQRLIAVADGHAGIALISLDANGHPTLLSRIGLGLNPADPPHPEAGGWVHSVAWAGRYLFAANWKRGLVALDTLDIRNPGVVMEIRTAGTALGVKAQLQPDGSYLIFLADGEAGLAIYRFTARQLGQN